jgi:Transglutaminase-like superfamily
MRLATLSDPAAWRGALWARRAVIIARRQLRAGGLRDLALEPPYRLPPAAESGVRAVLRRQPSTCLERAVVLQRWLQAQGDSRAIVIGVRRGEDEFRAHAWVEGEYDRLAPVFEELLRVPAETRP